MERFQEWTMWTRSVCSLSLQLSYCAIARRLFFFLLKRPRGLLGARDVFMVTIKRLARIGGKLRNGKTVIITNT